MEPAIQYARTSDGLSIAYYAIGEGHPLVLVAPGSNLQQEWRYVEQRCWLEELALHYRIIRFDIRGAGLSDRVPVFEPDVATLDIEAVTRREGLKRFALFGLISAAAITVLYVHKYPQHVSHLILWAPYARFSDLVGNSPALKAVRAAQTVDWHTITEFLAEFLTGRAEIEKAKRYAAYFRECWTAEDYFRFMGGFAEIDLTPQLGGLAVPVLVVQPKGAAFPTIETSRMVAAAAPRSRFVLLDGEAVYPFLGDTNAGLAAIEEFLSEPDEQRPDGLTDRELEILSLVAAGSSNERIAGALSISRRTVERHIGNIYLKIGAHNRAEATAYAFRQRIAPAQ
jgi:pimeloyl-ACP methyl ester carboxylesterase/DNA-binding CsgD family transcriptional regulator